MSKAILALGLATAALTLGASDALAQNPDHCRKALGALTTLKPDEYSSEPCRMLAVMVANTAKVITGAADVFLKDERLPATSIFSPRHLQPRYTQLPAMGGTPAQGHAIPSVQPAGVAAGTIAAVGTNAGTDALAAISVNPAVLAFGDEASKRLARLSRLADITVFLPVSDVSREGEEETDSKAPKYYGVRVRLNLTGARAGDEVWAGAARLFSTWIDRNRRNSQRVLALLAEAPDVTGCAKGLIDGAGEPAIITACGSSFTFDVDLSEASRLRDELARVRRAADAKYFGADFRFDKGDPTLGEEANAAGTFLFAGLAFGRTLASDVTETARYGVRGRLGLRHAKLDSVDQAEFAMEGTAGFEFSRAVDDQELNGSIGLEFRHGNAADDLLETLNTNFGIVRGSLILPVTAGNSMSLNAGVPLWGGVSPVLSVNFNWGVLLSGPRSR